MTYRDQNDGTCSHAIVSATATVDAYSPDLSASMSVTGERVTGGTLHISATVRNDGGGTAGASTAQVWAVSPYWDDYGEYQFRYLVAQVPIPSLEPNAASSITADYTIPISILGYLRLGYHDWRIDVIADANNAVTELDENNNTTSETIQVGRADLVPVPESVAVQAADGTARAGGVITITGSIKNQGVGTAGGSWVRIALVSPYWDESPLVYPVGSVPIGVLAPDATASFTINYTLPGSVRGTWTVWVTADASQTPQVQEDNEANNDYLGYSFPVTGADLTVDPTLTATTTNPAAGGTLVVTGTVRNQREGTAGASTLNVVLVSPSLDEYGEHMLYWTGAGSVGPLSAGASAPFRVEAALAVAVDDRWSVKVIADGPRTIDEEVESNNEQSTPIVIQQQ